jgi:hypothetical protein
MSNIGRPRTGLKACTFCGSTERDSNGQCHCRNIVYRLVAKAPQQKTKIIKTFNAALAEGENIEGAANMTRAKVPAVGKVKVPAAKKVAKKAAKKAKKAPAKKSEPTPVPVGPDETKPRYILTVDGFEETPYARKDAAIKNGVRSGQEWTVTYKGKTVATSEV